MEGYIDIQKVKLCRIQPDPQWWNGRQVWVGVDLSQTDDNTAVAMVTEDNGYIYARVMGFIPKEKINIKTQKEHVDYQRMISKGERLVLWIYRKGCKRGRYRFRTETQIC